MVIPLTKARSNTEALEHQEAFPWSDTGNLDLELSRLAFAVKRAEEIPTREIPHVLSQLAAIQATAAAAQATLVSRMTNFREGKKTRNVNIPERWLTADEAASLLKVDRKWLYRRANALPFTRRLSRKKLLFSESGMRRWMATRKP